MSYDKKFTEAAKYQSVIKTNSQFAVKSMTKEKHLKYAFMRINNT